MLHARALLPQAAGVYGRRKSLNSGPAQEVATEEALLNDLYS